MKPVSDLFDGIVVFISPGATLKNPNVGELIVKRGGLVVENVNARVRDNFFCVAKAPEQVHMCSM
jgi:hypothetical protein